MNVGAQRSPFLANDGLLTPHNVPIHARELDLEAVPGLLMHEDAVGPPHPACPLEELLRQPGIVGELWDRRLDLAAYSMEGRYPAIRHRREAERQRLRHRGPVNRSIQS